MGIKSIHNSQQSNCYFNLNIKLGSFPYPTPPVSFVSLVSFVSFVSLEDYGGMGVFSVLSTVFHYGILSEKTASIQSIEMSMSFHWNEVVI